MKYLAIIICIFLITAVILLLFSGKDAKAQTSGSAHQFTFVDINGQPLLLEDYAGKVVLIVNTASQCGFTGQYEGLQNLYDSYKDRGLVILGVPSNDFGGQEPGNEEEIKSFASEKYNVSFPMTEKYSVSGKDAHPFYQWAAEQGAGGLIFNKPRWNFHKYLIGPDGSLIESFGSQVSPDSTKLVTAIENHLPGL
ncbi:MAG: glutathione peroxidase [Alphaproteobacteria bacterium]